MATKIEWVRNSDGTRGETWNPVTGCTKISPGCAHCYAERIARRLAGRCGYPEAPHHFDVTLHPDKLNDPLKWKKPQTIFVCSMSDLFHESVPADYITHIYEVMAASPQHTFIVLTKRPERIVSVLYGEEGRWYLGGGDYLPNVWHMTSAENQETANNRIPELLKLYDISWGWPVLGVSVEPMLGAIDLSESIGIRKYLPALDWVICGGESGPGARPMREEWARDLRDQCREAGAPFFFKQMSKRSPIPDDLMLREFPYRPNSQQ